MGIKEEIKTWQYWAHIGTIAFLALLGLQLFYYSHMLNFKNWIISVILIGVSDVIAETIWLRGK